jgi:hypothetical protein
MSTIPVHIEARHAAQAKSAPHVSPLRHSAWDVLLVGLAFVHGAILLAFASPILIALGMWWNANTIAHNFIHRPFFTSRWMNRLFSFYLSLVLGIPQTIWRSRHLAHHADRPWKLKLTPQLLVEGLGVGLMWSIIALLAPKFFLIAYIPGYFAGLVLCWLQGKYEHVRGTTSHYGALYNFLFFNDGYHVEHHANPAIHWRELAAHGKADQRPSRYPAVLRWLECAGILGALETLVLKSKRLQHFVVNCHERAMRKVLDALEEPQRVGIVGGGLFPRSLIALKRIYPNSEIVAIEGDPHHIEVARQFERNTTYLNEWFDPQKHNDFDLLVVPLAYVGDRPAIYQRPPSPTVLVHDWIWRPHGRTAIVSPFLLKRINLVTQ